MTKKHITIWRWVSRFHLIALTIVAIAAALAATAGPWTRWAAQKDKVDVQQSAQLATDATDIASMKAKLDKVADDTAEIRGKVNTLVELMQAKGVGGEGVAAR